MRTTLDIDDDVLLAAKERARKDRISTGAALTQLARAGLGAALHSDKKQRTRGRFSMLPKRDEVITNEHVNRLRNELGI
jgi:hypothetical protein